MGFDPNAAAPTSTPTSGGPRFPGSGPAGVSKDWWSTTLVAKPASTREADQSGGKPMIGSPGGPQLTTVGQMLINFDTSDTTPDQTMQLQQLLWEGGFYGTGKKPTFTPGQRDTATRKAFTRAVQEASRQDTPFASFLNSRAGTRGASGVAGGGGGGGATRAPFRAELTNPADITTVLRDTLSKKLGYIPEDRLNAMVAAYQAQDTAAQQQAYNTAASGGTAVAAPTVAGFADTQARATDAVGYDARQVVDGLRQAFSMLAGGGDGG